TNSEFINIIGEYASKIAKDNNLYASVMVAQAALESGFGGSSLSSAPNYTLFGIKGSYNGQSVTMKTWENINGKNVTVNAKFKKYPSYLESCIYCNIFPIYIFPCLHSHGLTIIRAFNTK